MNFAEYKAKNLNQSCLDEIKSDSTKRCLNSMLCQLIKQVQALNVLKKVIQAQKFQKKRMSLKC